LLTGFDSVKLLNMLFTMIGGIVHSSSNCGVAFLSFFPFFADRRFFNAKPSSISESVLPCG
jgi:hypothetical protein